MEKEKKSTHIAKSSKDTIIKHTIAVPKLWLLLRGKYVKIQLKALGEKRVLPIFSFSFKEQLWIHWNKQKSCHQRPTLMVNMSILKEISSHHHLVFCTFSFCKKINNQRMGKMRSCPLQFLLLSIINGKKRNRWILKEFAEKLLRNLKEIFISKKINPKKTRLF